ncbi:hypothetical protein [Lysobacter sp. yr284]|uniref:hypothetical protein n=1 Tax=Lysobacter sp. yr284 TaxID=1761791 RepID=UPI001113E749|nr:hypothetical protein [Lysobacter sp. yr284]
MKLTIEGNIVQLDPQQGKAILWSKSGNYQQPKPLAITREEWNSIACFTQNTAAIIKRGATGERRLIKKIPR